ncbi:unnamed protein product [Ectocarpus sp. CCAP 1310/34]|nr:unnamed protein product [Ectocarpus sp. CCAP 1310/34]
MSTPPGGMASPAPPTVSAAPGGLVYHAGAHGRSGQPHARRGGPGIYDDKVFLFWEPPSFLSNWTPCVFPVHGIRDVCGEQFMMADKVRISGDDVACAKLMATSDPRRHNSLGSKASAFDGLWGIRVDAVGRRAMSPSKWPSQNILGNALVVTRTLLRVHQVEPDKPLHSEHSGLPPPACPTINEIAPPGDGPPPPVFAIGVGFSSLGNDDEK